MVMNNRLVKAGLAVLIMIFGISTSWAQLFTQSVLADESCLSAPSLTSMMTHDNHAYITTVYPTEYGPQGNLLKYRSQSGVIMDRNNLPIYRNGSVFLGADLWAAGANFDQFGAKGMLSRHKSDGHLWMSADKSSNKLIKVSPTMSICHQAIQMMNCNTSGALSVLIRPPYRLVWLSTRRAFIRPQV